MHVLRAEKGYVIVGQETDGSVTPIDLGFRADGWRRTRISWPPFAGASGHGPRRPQAVWSGWLTDDPNTVAGGRAQLIAAPGSTADDRPCHVEPFFGARIGPRSCAGPGC